MRLHKATVVGKEKELENITSHHITSHHRLNRVFIFRQH